MEISEHADVLAGLRLRPKILLIVAAHISDPDRDIPRCCWLASTVTSGALLLHNESGGKQANVMMFVN